MMKKLKLTTIIFAICCVSFLALLAFNPSHAYFQIFTDPVGINTAKVDLLFDKFNSDVVLEDGTTVNLSADWGTPSNPYVMTGKNHVNNLFILQKSKYFAQKVDSDGNPRQSYFRVANKDGTPLVIDCGGMNINPIGSPDNPFTGNIQGAPITEIPALPDGATEEQKAEYDAKYKYKGNSVSVSAIANLNVIASENTPDIGFFGYLGFEGDLTITTTKTPDGLDKDGNAVYKNVESATMDGFAASVSNLLFADVTIKTKQTVGANWWADAGKRTVTRITVDENGNASTPVTAEENIDSAHGECAETHHIGIVSGHSEFATLKDISVYYSEDVVAFDLPQADNSGTSFYSISGILGTLKFVNPTAVEGTTTLSSEDSISDPDLEITGGGGNKSGTMTGYMLAKNIFDAYDKKIAAEDKKEAYDTVLMTDIFTKVTMTEGSYFDPSYRNYYYFLDSIFTFAMSASITADKNGNIQDTDKDGTTADEIENRVNKDYVVRIWPIDETAEWNGVTPPPITISDRLDSAGELSWQYGPDDSQADYIHELKRVTSLDDMEEGKSYVLVYVGDNEATDPIYAFSPKTPAASGYYRTVDPYDGGMWVPTTDSEGDEVFENTTYATGRRLDTSGKIEYLYINSARNQNVCLNSFVYTKDRTFDDGTYSFGITSTSNDAVGGLGGAAYSAPQITTSKDNNSSDGTMRAYSWIITELSDTGRVKLTITATAENGSLAKRRAAFHSKLVFNPSSLSNSGSFLVRSKYNNNNGLSGSVSMPSEPTYYDADTAPNEPLQSGDRQDFVLFEVVSVYASSDVPINLLPDASTIKHQFNPSTDVLFFDKTTNGTNYYSVEPLESKKWNNGNGALLTELNHAVKMSKATQHSTQIVVSNSFLGDFPVLSTILGALFDENTGGVVYTPIGTTGKGYAIPAGTVAFDIQQASDADPSFINVVVAINPEDIINSSEIGLWYMEEGAWNTEFVLENPDQSFPLPISVTPNSSGAEQYMVNISNYTTKEGDVFTPHAGDYATHLRGETVLVGYSFRVTQPGIYLMASTEGPMNVAYFSVDGAAGYGDDGTGAAPLGSIDFVYDNGQGTIITVDKKYTEEIHELSKETLTTAYYPSYFYLRMYPNTPIPDSTTNAKYGPVPYDTIYIRRYIESDYQTINGKLADRKRYIYLSATDPDTHLRGTSSFYQDIPLANYPTT